MTSLVKALGDRVVGTVEEVSPDRIIVLLDPDAPQATALNTSVPAGFPRINGDVLIPNESGATACVVSSVRIQRLPFPTRKGMQQDFGLVDLPFPSRLMTLTPIGTLKAASAGGDLSFEVRRGVDVFPSVGDPVVLPSPGQLRAIVEGENQSTGGRILLGRCPTAGQAPVHVDPDKLFGRHLAVLGNTGAGKSCSVAGLIRWSLDAARRERIGLKSGSQEGEEQISVPNARFIVLDPNGEYARAFEDLDVRLFRVEPTGQGKPLYVPAWLWNGEEWAAFTGAAPGVQRPVLYEALRRLRSGLGPPEQFETKAKGRVRRYQSRIKVLVQNGEHQQSGKREGVAEVLLNLVKDCQDLVSDPNGSDEELNQVLQSVAQCATEVETAARSNSRGPGKGFWHNDFAEADLSTVEARLAEAAASLGLGAGEAILDEDVPRQFSVDELPDYVDALATEQSSRDIAQFVDTLNLRIRGLLSQGRLASVLKPDDSNAITLESWLDDYIGANQASNGTVAVVDLSLVPSEVTHIVVSVLARMIFEAIQRYRRENGLELPTTLVLEEAHTFVHRDLSGDGAPPAGRACARVFERIAREGRKFGLGLVLASQRPSEVSPTVLSQCNTFLLHRLVNDRDQELVKSLVPDGLGPLLRELPSLPTRRAILLGWAAPAPTLVEVQEIPASSRPHSPDPAFWAVWTGKEDRRIDWGRIARSWQRMEAESATDQGGNEAAD